MCRKCTHGSPVNHLLYPFRDSMAHFFALLMGSACAFVREMHQSVHLGQLKSSFGQCMTFCSARRPHRARRRLTKSHFELKSTHALRIPMASLPHASAARGRRARNGLPPKSMIPLHYKREHYLHLGQVQSTCGQRTTFCFARRVYCVQCEFAKSHLELIPTHALTYYPTDSPHRAHQENP